MLEVFVKSCELTITPAQTKPDSRPKGTTCSSNFILPLFTSPTSNATQPPGIVILYSSSKTLPIISDQVSTVRHKDILDSTSEASMSLNQHLNQLSAAYFTILRNGGEVTVRLIESFWICEVYLESRLEKVEFIVFNSLLNLELIFLKRLLDFLRIISLVFLYGGAISNLALINF